MDTYIQTAKKKSVPIVDNKEYELYLSGVVQGIDFLTQQIKDPKMTKSMILQASDTFRETVGWDGTEFTRCPSCNSIYNKQTKIDQETCMYCDE